MTDYDPERALWVPGRRSFLFMLGSVAAGTVFPGLPSPRIIVYPDGMAMVHPGVHLTASFEKLNQAILDFIIALERVPPNVLAEVKK